MSQTVYVTKYALSEGVRQCEYMQSGADSSYVYAAWPGAIGGTIQCRLGVDAWHTKDEAMQRFESLRAAAIKSAEKRIAKLRKLEFTLS